MMPLLMVRSRSPPKHLVIKSYFFLQAGRGKFQGKKWKGKVVGFSFWPIARSAEADCHTGILWIILSKDPVIKERSRAEQASYEYTSIIFYRSTVIGKMAAEGKNAFKNAKWHHQSSKCEDNLFIYLLSNT